MIRSDLSVEWELSPRIITVAAPSVEITIQDLHDTCRSLESAASGVDERSLIDSAGKEDLGGDVAVGLTATLQNAVVAFEARPGPDWVLCKITGGNLVAKDLVGVGIDPRHPTAFTTVDRTASSSATTQGVDAIARMSFGEKVTVDVVNGSSFSTFTGDTLTLGNIENPVNNFQDAKIIADHTGFTDLFVKGNATIENVDLRGFKIIGNGAIRCKLSLEPSAQLESVLINDATITGTLDGNTFLERCMISGINYFNGLIFNCAFDHQPVLIRGSAMANFFDCKGASDVDALIIFDCLDASAPLTIRNFSGCFAVTNRNVPATSCINFTGECVLDESCVVGAFDLSGNGDLVSNILQEHVDSGDVSISSRKLTHSDEIAKRVWSEDLHSYTTPDTAGKLVHDINFLDSYVYIDTELGSTGHGTSDSPFSSVADAVDFAESTGRKQLRFLSDATLERKLKNFVIEGIGSLPVIDINGQDVDKSEFHKVKMTGLQVGSVAAREVVLLNLQGVNGIYKDSGIIGDIVLADDAIVTIANVSNLPVSASMALNEINMGNGSAGSVLNLRKYSGGIELTNVNNPDRIATCEFSGGQIVLNGSNTDGVIGIVGLPDTAIFDTSAGSVVSTIGVFPGAGTISDSVWGTDDAKKLIEDILGRAVISPDDLHVTIYNRSDNSISHEFDISADKRIRTPITPVTIQTEALNPDGSDTLNPDSSRALNPA